LLLALWHFIGNSFGPAAVEYMKPLFDFIDASMAKPSFRGVANKMLMMDA